MAENPLRAMENAVGIVQLRLSDDPWSKQQGERMLPQIGTDVLLAQIAVLAMQVRADLEEERP